MTDFGLETIELDLPPLVGALSRRLHDAGLPVTPSRSVDFARSLTLVRPLARRRLYWTARAVFVSDQAQVQAFDAVFFSIFGGRGEPRDLNLEDVRTVAAPADDRPRSQHRAGPRDAEQEGVDATVSSAPPGAHDPDDDVPEVEVPVALASDEERLGRKSFDALGPH